MNRHYKFNEINNLDNELDFIINSFTELSGRTVKELPPLNQVKELSRFFKELPNGEVEEWIKFKGKYKNLSGQQSIITPEPNVNTPSINLNPITEHIQNINNPHQTTLKQLGFNDEDYIKKEDVDINDNGIIDKAEALDDGQNNLSLETILGHLENTNNPHQTTLEQLGFNESNYISVDNFENEKEKSKAIELASIMMVGGGTISWSVDYRIKWTQPITVIGIGKGFHFSTDGYFEMVMPAVGVYITRFYNSPALVDTNGIPLGQGEVLYYRLPIGSNHTSNNDNFIIYKYTGNNRNFIIEENAIPIAIRFTNDGLYLFNKIKLTAGNSTTY